MSKAYKVTVDTKTFIRFWLVILGFAAVGFLLFKAATGLLIIGAALFFALAINPLVQKLAKLIPGNGIKLPIAIAYIIVVGCLSAFFAIVVPTIINETVNFARNFPETIKCRDRLIEICYQSNYCSTKVGLTPLTQLQFEKSKHEYI